MGTLTATFWDGLWHAVRRNAFRLPKPLQASGRLILTPQASVHIVDWNGQKLLLGVTPHQVTLLQSQPAEVQADA